MMEPSNDTAEHSISSEPVDVGSTPQSLARAVIARRPEYVRPNKIKVKIGTWNVAACPGTDKDLRSWFVDGRGIDTNFATLNIHDNPAVDHEQTRKSAEDVRLIGGDQIGLYVLGLQEVVDLNPTKDPLKGTIYKDDGPVDKWKAALEEAMPHGYQMVMADQMSGLLMLIYASPDVAATITNVSTRQVGTGLWGYFGNKGAIITRLVLGETTRMVFVNSHLASGTQSSNLDRRCWDVGQIISKSQFDPVVHQGVAEDEGEKIGEEDFAFWFGDLNFRLEGLPGDDIRRLLTLHATGEYAGDDSKPKRSLEGEGVLVGRASESDDGTNSSVQSNDASYETDTTLPDPDDFPEDPSLDPTSLQSTLDSLITHDQLRKVIADRKAFHDGWKEGPITFLPSYKYDVGTLGLFDSSEKHRAPSWCDRILYRTRSDRIAFEKQAAEELAAKKRDEELKARGVDQDDDVLFSYDPGEDEGDEPAAKDNSTFDYDEYDEGDDDQQGGTEVITQEGYKDRISLDIYTSHQRITSSDHKPVISIFTLDYDAVVPELKAKVHAEVARELDRAENEGRPGVTIIVEGTESQDQAAVDFGDLQFLETKQTSLTLANTGSVAATFSFVEKPRPENTETEAPRWLYTSFINADDREKAENLGSEVTLEPGETVLALLEASVSALPQVQALNHGKDRLDDVLVLRVADGRDHFIPVRANWLPTAFGRSLNELIRIPDCGIRRFVQDEKIRGEITNDLPVQCSAPKELFKLTEAMQILAERCVADEAMLDDLNLPREPGWPFDAATWMTTLSQMEALKVALVAALDTNKPLIEALPIELSSANKIEVMASTLVHFLRSLTDSIIPPTLCQNIAAALPNLASASPTSYSQAKTQILDILSSAPNHNIAFVFLTATLARVSSELTPVTADVQQTKKKHLLSRRISIRGRLGRDDKKEEGDLWEKRRARDRRFAEILGPWICKTDDPEKSIGRGMDRAIVEVCMGRDDEG